MSHEPSGHQARALRTNLRSNLPQSPRSQLSADMLEMWPREPQIQQVAIDPFPVPVKSLPFPFPLLKAPLLYDKCDPLARLNSLPLPLPFPLNPFSAPISVGAGPWLSFPGMFLRMCLEWWYCTITFRVCS